MDFGSVPTYSFVHCFAGSNFMKPRYLVRDFFFPDARRLKKKKIRFFPVPSAFFFVNGVTHSHGDANCCCPQNTDMRGGGLPKDTQKFLGMDGGGLLKPKNGFPPPQPLWGRKPLP